MRKGFVEVYDVTRLVRDLTSGEERANQFSESYREKYLNKHFVNV